MKNKLLSLIAITAISIAVQAQVKIGDNPTSINSNSLLELESANKGILCPRIALNDELSTSPLSGTVPEGMLVYNATGSLEKGFYTWSGTRWMQLLTNATERDNYVLVKSASDLPAPVAGIITLDATKHYEINGTVTLTNKLDLNGCTVYGYDHLQDKLLYTPTTGELFTGSNGGTIKMLTLSSTGTTSELFDLDAGGAQKNLILQSCLVAGNTNLGIIKGFDGNVLFSDIILGGNDQGFIFEDIDELDLNNLYWMPTNSGTFEKYVGDFTHIRKAGGDAHASSANSAVAIDLTGLVNLEIGDLKNVLFLGDGTYVLGSFSSTWEVEAHGLETMKDGYAAGNLYTTTPIANPIATFNVPEKVLGTTTSVNLFRVSSLANNRLTYTGKKTRYFSAVASVSVASAASAKNFTFYIAKNGVVLPESAQTLRLSASTDKGSLTVSCNVLMSTNDYVELYVKNESDQTGITIMNMNMSIK
jgi:hypothetical protein